MKEAKGQEQYKKPFNGNGKLDVFKSDGRRNLKDFIRSKKFARQRARKGYCDRDVWNFYIWFMDIIPDILKKFRDFNNGIPTALMVEEYENNRQDYPHVDEEYLLVGTDKEPISSECDLIRDRAAKKWTDIINEIIAEFETLRRMDDEVWDHNSDYDEYFAEMQRHLDNAFALLQKRFFDFWF